MSLEEGIRSDFARPYQWGVSPLEILGHTSPTYFVTVKIYINPAKHYLQPQLYPYTPKLKILAESLDI